MFWTKEETDRTLLEIMARSQRDAAFRGLCIKDPRAAVQEVSGHAMAIDFNLRFVDNAGADLTLVLPDPIGSEGAALSDEELSSVRGGVIGGTSGGAPVSGWVQIQNIRLMKG